jgi:hypothetical protein
MQSLDAKDLLNAEKRLEKRFLEFAKIPVPYIALLALAALTVSFIGATFSVTGLAKLFSGAPVAVMFMAGALEFAKIVAAGFLHHNWRELGGLLKTYLSLAVAALMAVTSLGIFGYLSNAYQKSSMDLKHTEIRIQAVEGETQKIATEIGRLQKALDEIPMRRVTKRLEFQKESEPEFKRLKTRELELGTESRDLLIKKSSLQAEVGPLVYVAESFHVSMDEIAKWFILIFVSVFDPLAICLVFAVSWSLKHQPTSKRHPPLAAPQAAKDSIRVPVSEAPQGAASIAIQKKVQFEETPSISPETAQSASGPLIKGKWLPFDEARAKARELDISSSKRWLEIDKKDLPKGVPKAPQAIYRDRGWVSWTDWLGRDS